MSKMVDTAGINKLGKMRERVKLELERIPGDNPAQKELRMVYWMARMHSLGKKSHDNLSREDVLRESVKAVKEDFPDFKPNYDKRFFHC